MTREEFIMQILLLGFIRDNDELYWRGPDHILMKSGPVVGYNGNYYTRKTVLKIL